MRLVQEHVQDENPDLVIGFGTGGYRQGAARQASRARCVPRMAYYFNNEFADTGAVSDVFDAVLVPSDYMGQYLRESAHVDAHVLLTIRQANFVAPDGRMDTEHAGESARGVRDVHQPCTGERGALLYALSILRPESPRADVPRGRIPLHALTMGCTGFICADGERVVAA
ncbi:MAG: hypothetical protein U5K43_05985 [Halofilum sp. (in: g-proteobacteria)]|nr:hypothetical protein [Halofilum sp. (in: g-proteobacteria)]